MTKSTITRERLQELAEGQSGFNLRTATHEESQELARIALAAMDGSEPVACGNGCSKSKWHKMALDIDEYMNGEDARESKGRDEIYSEIILRLTRLDVLETILRNEIGLPYGSPIPDIAEKIYDIKRARIYSVVPDDLSIFEAAIEECKKCDSIDEHAWNHGVLAVMAKYESCRAAILQAVPLTSEGDIALHNYRTALEGIGHIRRTLEETFGGLHGTHVEPDVLMECKTICDAIYAAYSGNSPVIPDGYVMVPREPTEEMLQASYREASVYSPTAYRAMIAAAQKEVKGE